MAFNVRLETTGPGQGIFHFAGIGTPAGSLELAIQRNRDDKYLGEGRGWQTTPHWHLLSGVETDDGELSVRAGPEIVDPVAAASSMALRVWVRRQGVETSAVLRTSGHLLGSPAASRLDVLDPPVDTTPEQEPEPGLDLELIAEPRESLPERDDSSRSSRGLLTGLLLFVLALAAGIGAWQLGWLDQWLTADDEPRTALEQASPEESTGSAQPASEAAQIMASDTSPAGPGADAIEASTPADTPQMPSPRGLALARAFLSETPDPQAIQREAELQEQAGDCDAAMVLYNNAAQADPEYALTLGVRLDPDGFEARPCTQTPDPIAASVWYQEAAAAGNPSAQRRLGRFLIESEGSGPLFEDGVRWLSRAAKAGDKEAKALLDRLAKP